nr:uncharacterized protein LOC123774798 [Procambarus clarkii]XP_045625372.1 uncharacterized protein LOC123774798 [Procambarus clarkii]
MTLEARDSIHRGELEYSRPMRRKCKMKMLHIWTVMGMLLAATVLVIRQREAAQHPSSGAGSLPAGRTGQASTRPEEQGDVDSAGGKPTSACRDAVRSCVRQRLREPLSWRDARLIKFLKEMIEPPPRKPSRLRPRQPPWQDRPSFNTSEVLLRTLFQGQKSGVFVEVGAQDGLWLSNTWWLEATQGWRGLLVEADPINYGQLRASPRASSTLPVCVSVDPYASSQQLVRTRAPSNFTRSLLKAQQGRSQLVKYASASDLLAGEIWNTTCYPLLSVLKAAGYTQIDLLTFDLSGGGMEMTTGFLALNKALGYPFHVKLLLYQDNQLEQFFDIDEVKNTYTNLGYHTMKITGSHYFLYHQSINIVFV